MHAQFSVAKGVVNILKFLSPRQRAIIEGRYGLRAPVCSTLAKLGVSYGVTRERVRQIESLALRALSLRLEKSKELDGFIAAVVSHIENAGGAQKEGDILDTLSQVLGGTGASEVRKNQIKFLIELARTPQCAKETNTAHAFWYLKENHKKTVGAFHKKLAQTLTENREGANEILGRLANTESITLATAKNYAAISKLFGTNVYGDFGLAEWPEICPTTARDWAYVVLKKTKKPLHFMEIAKAVNAMRRAKPVHHQTVHNELIKDDTFVLVGKGMYGLRECGFVPGTAREVIARLLAHHGPLTIQELARHITKERFYKPNTIAVNLQNKKRFSRLPDGRYTTLA